jgi:catechol 2,3-dioxygenase-like lactoylglutathione lyase family enzyme
VGHVVLTVSDLRRSAEWWRSLGMRPVFDSDDEIAIFELRGGTHLLLFPGDTPRPGTDAPFDLMVDDIDATHAAWQARGLAPSELSHAAGDHLRFTVRDPDGYTLSVFNSHVVGPV